MSHAGTLYKILHNALPSYLWPLLSLNFSLPLAILIIILVLVLIAVLFIYFWYKSVQKFWKEEYIFLEVRPTDRTLKSPHATNELFKTLHSLIKQDSSRRKSISLELVSTKEEGIRYIVRVPTDEASTIKKILLGYVPGISITEIADYLSIENTETQNTNLVIKELRLKTDFVNPLKEQELLNQYDPIANTATHMTKLEHGELVALQLIATPVTSTTHGSLVGYTDRLREKLLSNEDISGDIQRSNALLDKFIYLLVGVMIKLFEYAFVILQVILDWIMSSKSSSSSQPHSKEKKVKRISELSITKQQLFKTIGDKISQPLFEVTIRICIQTKDANDGVQRAKGILSSFDTFGTSYQAFTLHNLTSQPIPFLHLSKLDSLYALELKHRFSLFTASPVLSISELSSIYHFPNINSTNIEDLLQVKNPYLASPLSLKQSDIDLDIIFAQNKHGGTITPIGQVLEERRRHTYIIGTTGSGKSNFLKQMIYQDIVNGKGVAVIDPHGELIDDLLGVIPHNRLEDVVLIDPYDIDYPVAINLLELPQGLTGAVLQREKDFITSNIISMFQKLSGEKYWGPRMERVLRNTLLTALETEHPTLQTVYDLLMKEKVRKPIVDKLTNDMLKSFWKDEFEKLKVTQRLEYVTPITNKMDKFLTSKFTSEIITKEKSTIDFVDIMNNKKILLVNLSQGNIGEDISSFLGCLLISKIQLTALGRVKTKEEDRVDFFLYIDEFQNFATLSFIGILSGARKYRLDLIIVHQNITQIDNEVYEAIVGNTSTDIAFRITSPSDEDKLLPLFAPQVEKGQLHNLPSYTFYVKIHGLQPQDAFMGEVEKFSIKPDETVRQKVIALSREKYGVKIELVKDDITDKTEAVKPPSQLTSDPTIAKKRKYAFEKRKK